MRGTSLNTNARADVCVVGAGISGLSIAYLLAREGLSVVVIEEFSQMFVGGRTFDLGDLVFDLAGILFFGEIARLICRRKMVAAKAKQS